MKCTYCYWFRDKDVYTRPKLLPLKIEEIFLERLCSHIQVNKLTAFSIIFHGGEPLLFGKARFRSLCQKLERLAEETGARIDRSMTTNGLLLDANWALLLREYGVRVTLSLDGSESQHDARRVDLRGRGTYTRVVAALATLRGAGIEPGILAVCEPDGDPEELLSTFVGELGLSGFDVLIPDATHEDCPRSVAAYYIRLFDLWFDQYSQRGVRIRLLENLVRSVLDLKTSTEALGYGPVTTLCVTTDGALEPLDVLRIRGDGATRTTRSVITHQIQEVVDDPVWNEAYRASLELSETCQRCELRQACGGGYLPSRWSNTRRYDNPSVYCQDLQRVLHHVWQRVQPSLYLQT